MRAPAQQRLRISFSNAAEPVERVLNRRSRSEQMRTFILGVVGLALWSLAVGCGGEDSSGDDDDDAPNGTQTSGSNGNTSTTGAPNNPPECPDNPPAGASDCSDVPAGTS